MLNVRMNVLDRAAAAISPSWGMKRMAARATLSAASALTSSPTSPDGGRIGGQGGYKGSHTNRRQTRGWFARPRSANADTLGNQKTVIGRARDAAMNMPLATAAIERPVTFTVGTGLMAIPDLKADELGISAEEARTLGAQIAADFDNYMSSTDPDAARTATGYDQQEIVLRGVLESGDILGVRVMPPNQIGRYHETAWKLYEADRVVSPANHDEGGRLGGAGNVVAGGVEVDEFTAPIAYHVLKTPPNGFNGVAIGRMPGDTVRLDAWGTKSELPTCVHVMTVKRPEQFRGASVLAPVLEILQQVSTLSEAEAFAAVLTSMVAIIYKSKNGNPMPEPDYSTDRMVDASEAWQTAEADAGGRASDYPMEVGSTWEIDHDDEVEMKSPGRPNPAFEPFFKALAHQISAAVEVPYEVLMLAFNASYSASRGALEVFYQTVRKRRDWLAAHWCTPVYRAWLYEQVAKGRYRMPGFLTNRTLRERWSNVRFRGDGKISLDPGREAKALEVHEAHAWKTGAEITAELTGGDYDANVERRAGEHRRFVDAGLPIPNQQGGGSAPATDQPQPTEVPA